MIDNKNNYENIVKILELGEGVYIAKDKEGNEIIIYRFKDNGFIITKTYTSRNHKWIDTYKYNENGERKRDVSWRTFNLNKEFDI